MATYSAMDIAKFIVNDCTCLSRPISNLKLQKLLYFIWVDYYKRKKTMLFKDEMCAWQLGPVVPDVYFEFCSYGGQPIYENYTTNLTENDQVIVREILHSHVRNSTRSLVDMTHRKGSPWDRIFRNGAGNRQVIPFDLIKSIDCTEADNAF